MLRGHIPPNFATATSFRASAPYPPVEVEAPNLRYAQLLHQDTASAQGEFTAVTLYIYQSWLFDPVCGPAAKTMREIAIVEMHHLDLLSQVISLLGGDPTFSAVRNNRCIVWNGSMVNYCKNLPQMIRYDIRAEQEAIANYRRHIAFIKDRHIQALLERIIEDEEIHLAIFRQMLERLESV